MILGDRKFNPKKIFLDLDGNGSSRKNAIALLGELCPKGYWSSSFRNFVLSDPRVLRVKVVPNSFDPSDEFSEILSVGFEAVDGAFMIGIAQGNPNDDILVFGDVEHLLDLIFVSHN
jgi:hypothetical protein